MLRTRILHRTRGTGGTTVMITSALSGEGKTVTAVNLALTFAKAFSQTALLVDADLKRQQVHQVLGFESDRGLGDYLQDGCDVSDLIVWPGIEKLTVISGGKRIEESSELLGSPGMRTLVEGMKSRYEDRYVFFDVPPVLAGADAICLRPPGGPHPVRRPGGQVVDGEREQGAGDAPEGEDPGDRAEPPGRRRRHQVLLLATPSTAQQPLNRDVPANSR